MANLTYSEAQAVAIYYGWPGPEFALSDNVTDALAQAALADLAKGETQAELQPQSLPQGYVPSNSGVGVFGVAAEYWESEATDIYNKASEALGVSLGWAKVLMVGVLVVVGAGLYARVKG